MQRATCVVTLAGKAYEIEQLNRRKSKPWRAKYLAPMTGLVDGLRNLAGVDFSGVENAQLMQMLGGTSGNALDTVLNVLDYDAMFDALCEYSPAIAKDREDLEESDAFYDQEISAAFWALVQLASPFGVVVKYGRRFIDLLKSSPDDASADTKDEKAAPSKS